MMKKLLVAVAFLAAIVGAQMQGVGAQAVKGSGTKTPKPTVTPTPSPTPSPSPSPTPPPAGCIRHLASGGKLTQTGSAVTAPVNDPGKVIVFIGLAVSTGLEAPTPILSGGGTTWTWLGTFYKNDGAPRDETLYSSDGPVSGPLTITVPSPGKNHLAWSIDGTDGAIASVAVNSEGGLETGHSVDVGHAPIGQVIAGYIIGQQQDAFPVAPYVLLGQGHTSFITVLSEVGPAQVASVVWPQAGHSEGIAVETTCPA